MQGHKWRIPAQTRQELLAPVPEQELRSLVAGGSKTLIRQFLFAGYADRRVVYPCNRTVSIFPPIWTEVAAAKLLESIELGIGPMY